MSFFRLFAILSGLVGIAAVSPGYAQSTIVEASHGALEISVDRTTVAPGQKFWLAAKFTPREEWHTYWVNPGDSGATPAIEWQTRDAFTFADPLFPLPERMPVGPLMNYGYNGPNTLLIEATAPDILAGDTAEISFVAEWLVCKVECVPQDAEGTIELQHGDGGLSDSNRATFIEARKALADPSYWDSELYFDETKSTLTVYMAAEEAALVKDAQYFPLQEGVTDYAAPQTVNKVEEGLEIVMPRYEGAEAPVSGNGLLVITGLDGERQGFDIEVEAKPVPGKLNGLISGKGAQSLSLWQVGLFALVGGLILNLMPCVFPILSLKAFSFIAGGSRSQASRRSEGWAYTAGVVVSFWVVVAALVILREGGAAIGWGFQLQEPLFVAFMAAVMVLVGLSLSGLFSFNFRFFGLFDTAANKKGDESAFFTGALATLVATPCSAPLMAPAIGFALTQSIPVIAFAFTMLGFGMALPFLALSYSPGMARRLPRPGPWMEKVKQGLAFPMYLTAVWLMYVLLSQAGGIAVILFLGGLVVVGFALWLDRQTNALLGSVIAKGIAIFAFIATAASIMEIATTETGNDGKEVDIANELQAVEYSPARLEEILNTGKPVFAYFTADWCITCKVNERIALFRDETIALMRDNDVQVVVGDWTNRNKDIADLLAVYGRAGVPLYLFYPAGSREPVLLPEVLTISILRDAINTGI